MDSILGWGKEKSQLSSDSLSFWFFSNFFSYFKKILCHPHSDLASFIFFSWPLIPPVLFHCPPNLAASRFLYPSSISVLHIHISAEHFPKINFVFREKGKTSSPMMIKREMISSQKFHVCKT